MKTKKILRDLLSFVLGSRRSGTTTLIKKIASENDVWVLVPNQELKEEFGKSAITLDNLPIVISSNKKPILVDNLTLIHILNLSESEIHRLDLMTRKRDSLIQTIKREISLFETNEILDIVNKETQKQSDKEPFRI